MKKVPMMFSQATKRGALWVAAAFVFAVGASRGALSAQETAPPEPTGLSDKLAVDNSVTVTGDGITVVQEHVFKEEFQERIWNALDEDKNGRLSKKEKSVQADKLRPTFGRYTAFRLNWNVIRPIKVDVEVKGLKRRKPKNWKKVKPVTLTFTVTYPYKTSPLDMLDLVVTGINAKKVTGRFKLDPSMQLLRSNGGNITSDQTAEMVQIDGKPNAFSVILIKQSPPKK